MVYALTATVFLLLCSLSCGIGFIFGAKHYANRIAKPREFLQITEEIIDQYIKGDTPKGDIVKVNAVENYLKDHNKEEIRLGDLIEIDNI